MTLKELLDKVSELCNDETKDLKVNIVIDGVSVEISSIYQYNFKNDYITINEMRII